MKGFLNSQEEEDVNHLQQKHLKQNKFLVFSGGKKEHNHEIPERPLETPCQCQMSRSEKSIFCNRHQCLKSKSLHSLCQTRMDYFDMWENGEGPMQDPINKIMTKRGQEKTELLEGEEAINTNPHETRGFFETGNDQFFMGDSDIPSESRGLGDTIAKITKATGIKKVTDAVFGALNKDCGCRERQSKLNKLFPYGKKKKTKGFFE